MSTGRHRGSGRQCVDDVLKRCAGRLACGCFGCKSRGELRHGCFERRDAIVDTSAGGISLRCSFFEARDQSKSRELRCADLHNEIPGPGEHGYGYNGQHAVRT